MSEATRAASELQLELLMRSDPISASALRSARSTELVAYTRDKAGFLKSRQELFGDRFAALGAVVEVAHEEVARLVLAPQRRGPYLGAFPSVEETYPRGFLLFQDDDALSGSSAHRDRRAQISGVILRDAPARQGDAAALAILEELAERVREVGWGAPARRHHEAVEHAVTAYMAYVLLGLELDEEAARGSRGSSCPRTRRRAWRPRASRGCACPRRWSAKRPGAWSGCADLRRSGAKPKGARARPRSRLFCRTSCTWWPRRRPPARPT